MSAYPQLDLFDEIVRIVGWPTLIAGVLWVVRTWEKSQQQAKTMAENTQTAVKTVADVKAQVTLIETNHLAHLQSGIEKVAESNDKAVESLQNIDTNIKILIDRFPRG